MSYLRSNNSERSVKIAGIDTENIQPTSAYSSCCMASRSCSGMFELELLGAV